MPRRLRGLPMLDTTRASKGARCGVGGVSLAEDAGEAGEHEGDVRGGEGEARRERRTGWLGSDAAAGSSGRRMSLVRPPKLRRE